MSDNDFDVINRKLDFLIVEVKALSISQQKLFSLLSERSKEIVEKEIISEHVSGVNLEENLPEPAENIEAKVGVITALAVGVLNHDGTKICWIPKKAINNLDRIAIKQGDSAKLVIADWFQPKIKWVKNEPRG